MLIPFFNSKTTQALPSKLAPQRAQTSKLMTQPKFSGESGDIFTRLIGTDYATSLSKSKESMSFQEYLVALQEKPALILRNPTQYAVDAIKYYDKQLQLEPTNYLGEPTLNFSFTKRPWQAKSLTEKGGIQGQRGVLSQVLKHLEAEAVKHNSGKLILVHGPNGSGKTNMMENLFDAFENYSNTDEGVLYRLTWVFPEESKEPVVLSMASMGAKDDEIKAVREAFSQDSDDGVAKVTIPANLNTQPFSLLPIEARVKLLEELKESGKLPETFNSDYLIKNKLDSMSDKLMEALLKMYLSQGLKPDQALKAVYSHVRVERFNYSTNIQEGLVIKPPMESPDAITQVYTAPLDFSRLPRDVIQSLQRVNLSRISGPLAQANRGHILYDDFGKAPGGASHIIPQSISMLRWLEKGKLTPAGGNDASGDNVNLIAWGTTNDVNIQELLGSKEWGAIRERFKLIPMGYERDYTELSKIFSDAVQKELKVTPGRGVDKNAINTLALFQVLTTLFTINKTGLLESIPDLQPEEKEELSKAISKLTDNAYEDIYKALLYANQPLDSFSLDATPYKNDKVHFTPEEETVLKKYVPALASQYTEGNIINKFFMYEGQFGLSVREGLSMLSDAFRVNPKRSFSALDVIRVIEERAKSGFAYADDLDKTRGMIAGSRTPLNAADYNRTMDAAKKQDPDQVPKETPSYFTSIPDLIKQLKWYVAKETRYDFIEAAGMLSTKEKESEAFYRYYEHAKALMSKKDVPAEHREPSSSPEPNLEFMARIEKALGLNTKEKVDEFRAGMTSEVGSWAMSPENEGKTIGPKNFDQVFPNEVKQLIEKNLEENKDKFNQVLGDLKAYFASGNKFPPITEANKDRITTAQDTLKALLEKGYHQDTLQSLMFFAFEDILKNL